LWQILSLTLNLVDLKMALGRLSVNGVVLG
jgi:hypothetical protein